MNAQDILLLLFILAVIAVPLMFLFPDLRWLLQTWRSSRWPLAPAVIHKAGAEHIEGSETELAYNRSLFGYSYEVDGVRHAGFFAAATRDLAEANLLQRKLAGRPVAVRFKPTRPGISVLAVREIEGFRAMQTPRWVRPGNSLQQLYLTSLTKTHKSDTATKG